MPLRQAPGTAGAPDRLTQEIRGADRISNTVLTSRLALVTLLATAVTGPAGHADPPETWPQRSAQPPVTGPATKTCAVRLMKDYPFKNTAYGPDRNFRGTYRPPAACRGPWAKVILTLSGHVDGVQYDRIGHVRFGDVQVLRLSTPEPVKQYGQVTWQVQRDITPYASILQRRQPVEAAIGNVVTDVYTGIFYGTLDLAFHQADRTHPAGRNADVVVGGPDVAITDHEVPARYPMRFPRNLVRLEAEVWSRGGGGCDEFWWNNPDQCGISPYREILVTVDGQYAGVAPAYPMLATGGGGPDFWHPIPAPRAFDIRPYVLDLTPFVATLTDGRQHMIAVRVLGWEASEGNSWSTQLNVHQWLNPRSRGRTTGALYPIRVEREPTERVEPGPGGALRAEHDVAVSGWLQPAGGARTSTTVHHNITMKHQQELATLADWTWITFVTTAVAGRETRSESTSTYHLESLYGGFRFVDANTTKIVVDDQVRYTSTFDDRMETYSKTGPGVLPGGVSWEIWRESDSAGRCVMHELRAAAGAFVVDQYGTDCQSPDLAR